MSTAVLVVGAGPVGLTMAAELARYRVPVRIIDKAAARTDKSKALVLWSRSVELIARMGCVDAFIASGMKATRARISAGGHQIGQIGLEGIASPYPYALMISQSETERAMEEHLNACGVAVERQVELTGFEAKPDSVTATLRRPDGYMETVDAAWLIGCDGAHSTVRHGLGLQFEGDTLPSQWILADVHVDGSNARPDEIATYWHAEGVLAVFPIAPGRYRIVADLSGSSGDNPPPEPTMEEVQAVLDARGPGGLTAHTPIWLAGFRINERKVADYRVGRVFLAGDAAHVHSPAGGQGMNTGMQDAINLAWKLALVHRGLTAEEPLLGSYSIERSEIGRQVLANAGRLTAVATMRGGLKQELRNHVASLLFGLSPVKRAMSNTLTELSIGYAHSPLNETRHVRHSGPQPGERVIPDGRNRPVGAGDTPRFALFAEAGPASAALIARHPGLLEPEPRPSFERDGIWLVRPDGYAAVAAGRDGWDVVGDYLDRVAGPGR